MEKNGRLIYAWPNAVLSGSWGNQFDPDTFAASRKSCDLLQSANPFSAEDEANQRAAAIAKQKAIEAAELRHDLQIDRDLGRTLLCSDSKIYESPEGYGETRLAQPVEVDIDGASLKNGELIDWLRITPLEPTRAGLRSQSYYAHLTDIRESCASPDSPPEPSAPICLSAAALRNGIRAAGSLDAWPAYHAKDVAHQMEARIQAMDAAAITADQFPGRFMEAWNKRSRELGVDASQYQPAVAALNDLVRLCSSISASEYAAAIAQYRWADFNRYAGGKYKSCVHNKLYTAIPDTPGGPGFLLYFNLAARWQKEQQDWNGPKFNIQVLLKVPNKG